VEEVVWHVWGEVPEVPKKLRRLAFAHLLERKELADVLFSRGGIIIIIIIIIII
jgi:hypothetical protein